MSETKNIYQKLANVKAKLAKNPIIKDAENKFAGYWYASIDSILNSINPLLQEEGLSFSILNYTDENPTYKVKAVLADCESDTHLEFEYTISGAVITTKSKQESLDSFTYKIQDAGSAITYISRYVYGMVFAIPFQEDTVNKHTENPDYGAAKHVSNENKEAKKAEYLNVINSISADNASDELTKIYGALWKVFRDPFFEDVKKLIFQKADQFGLTYNKETKKFE